MQPPRSLDEIIDAFGIESLRTGAGLQIGPSGDLAVTADGDLRIGSVPFNAMYRLAQRWRFEEPTARLLFDAVMEAFSIEADLSREVETTGFADITQPPAREPTMEDVRRFRQIGDHQGALINGRGVAAGAVMVMLGNMLARFCDDLGLKGPLGKHGPPAFAGHSIGAVVQAAANNFRHHDEWARTKRPKDQQLISMICLIEVLEASDQPKPWGGNWVVAIRYNLCGEILRAISAEQFETLGAWLFEYAKSLAAPPASASP
jgi:hypothetical protein